MTTDVIRVEGLTKTFGSAHALNGLDLHVAPGEVHAFLGPNGAGKSTTIRVLLGLLRKTSGTVELLGGDPWAQAPELHRRLAYVPGDVTLWPNLSGGEIIDLMGRLRGGLDEARRAELIERFALDPAKKARTYSKGNRQKVALVAAFAARAELMILDEPTSGLDPLMEEVFTQCLAEAKAEGTSILLSSHILSEVDRVADTVTIIRTGPPSRPARWTRCGTSRAPAWRRRSRAPSISRTARACTICRPTVTGSRSASRPPSSAGCSPSSPPPAPRR